MSSPFNYQEIFDKYRWIRIDDRGYDCDVCPCHVVHRGCILVNEDKFTSYQGYALCPTLDSFMLTKKGNRFVL